MFYPVKGGGVTVCHCVDNNQTTTGNTTILTDTYLGKLVVFQWSLLSTANGEGKLLLRKMLIPNWRLLFHLPRTD